MRFRGPVATFTVVCLTSGLALGGWNGSAAGASSRHACPAELLTGETVVVSGFVANRAGTGAGSRRVLRLTDANILKGGQVCPVVGLMVRVSSRTSSVVSFVRAVNPALAVVSSGARNPYGHPHSEALARLYSAGVARVWRTDRNGTLCVEIDGQGRWRVQGERDVAGPRFRALTSHRPYS